MNKTTTTTNGHSITITYVGVGRISRPGNTEICMTPNDCARYLLLPIRVPTLRSVCATHPEALRSPQESTPGAPPNPQEHPGTPKLRQSPPTEPKKKKNGSERAKFQVGSNIIGNPKNADIAAL